MKKLKIFQLITLSEPGGAQRYVDNIVRYSGGKNEYTIIAGQGGEAFSKTPCRKIYLNNLVRKLSFKRDWLAYKELVALFRREKPDAVHCHSSKMGVLGRLAARKAGVKKIVYTVHGFVFRERTRLRAIYYWLEKRLAAKTDCLICVSKDDYDLAVRRKFKAKKIVYVPNGVDLNLYKFSLNSRKNNSILSGVCAANFYKTKGHEVLVKAMKQLGNIAKNLKIDFAGDFGTEKDKLQKLVKEYNLNNQIKFIGYQKNLPKLLPKYDFFILPSYKEGFPYVILEAMASGLPVISSRTGGIPTVVKHMRNCYLCMPGSITDFKNALTYLTQGGVLQVNRTALKNYDVRKVVKQIEQLY